MPNAFFTWDVSNLLTVRGGLLEHKGNTALDLVAGAEQIRRLGFDNAGLYTSFSNWAKTYNNSQAGIHFAFDFSDMLTLNATAAFPVNESWNAEGSDARLIFDADLDLGALTLSPVIHARFFRNNYYDVVNEKDKNSILWAFGVDADLELGGAFNLGAGIALGQITEFKVKDGNYSYRESMSGVLMRVSPSLDLGTSELTFNYSFGVGNQREKVEERSDYAKETDRMIYNDMLFGWQYRFNDHLAFGPFFGLTTASYVGKYDYKWEGDSEKGNYDDKFGWNSTRFGLNVVARF